MPEVLVIGAGIIGAACARSLAAAGLSVTVVERGSSAGGTSAACEGNLLVSDKGPGPELDLARLAATRWPRVATELAAELGPAFPSIEYERKGGMVVATTEPGAAALLAFADTQRPAGVEARALSAAEALDLEPDLNPSLTAAVHYPQDAQVQPTIATEALLASARAARRGGPHRCRGDRLPPRPGRADHRRTAPPQGDLYADAVLVAAGPVVRRSVRPAGRPPSRSGRAGAWCSSRPRCRSASSTRSTTPTTSERPSPATPACRPRAWWRAPRAAPC